MTNSLSVSLPQGASIVKNLEPEYGYSIKPSQIMCFPFKMRRYYNQLVVDLADITPFENCFVPAMRCWPSTVPVGVSLTSTPRVSESGVVLGPQGVTWNFWLIDLIDQPDLEPADIMRWIDPGQTYYMNVQNLQNKEHQFWCRFTFYGAGIKHVE